MPSGDLACCGEHARAAIGAVLSNQGRARREKEAQQLLPETYGGQVYFYLPNYVSAQFSSVFQ